jgi:hypothetical protein
LVRMTIRTPQAVRNGDFNDGLAGWGFGNCGATANTTLPSQYDILPPRAQTVHVVSTHVAGVLGHAALLTSAEDIACLSTSCRWTGGTVYIHLFARHIAGLKPQVILWNSTTNTPVPVAFTWRGTDWVQYSGSASPSGVAATLSLFLYASASLNSEITSVEYGHVLVSTGLPPAPVLLGTTAFRPVRVPYVYVSRNGYTNDWTAGPGFRHVLVDGLRNGWIVRSPGPMVHPTYAFAIWDRLGDIISALVAAILLFYVMSAVFVSRPRRHSRARGMPTRLGGEVETTLA